MVAGFLFLLHILLLAAAFIKYKKISIGEGFLSMAFIGIIFAVGWTIAIIVTNLMFAIGAFERWYWQPLNSWIWVIVRKEISRDTIPLILLTIGEAVFYYYFLNDKKKPPSSDGGNMHPPGPSSPTV